MPKGSHRHKSVAEVELHKQQVVLVFLLVLTVFFSHFLFGFNAKPAESGVLFRFHLSLFNVNKSVTKVQTFIYADNTAFTERLQSKW